MAEERPQRTAAQLFEAWIGFDIHGSATSRLHEFLRTRAEHLGFSSVAAYLDALPRNRPHTAEAQRLVNVVTNGLTAFWRDPQQLEVLGTLLTQLHQEHRRTIDIWCAGCATGEEAYSVALLADELGVPVRVLGTDVNTRFLDDARRAEFDDWSLRRLDDARRDRYFERRGPRWALDRHIVGAVEFRHHNVLDLPPAPIAGWDVVLGRNVIIYFTRNAAAQALSRFATALRSGGYLLLGSSEQIGSGTPHFRVAQHGPAFVYRPVVDDEDGAEVPRLFVDDLRLGDSLDEETADFLDEDAVPKLLRDAVTHEPDAAIACYEAASAYDPFAEEIYALLGIVLRNAGAGDRALRAFGKVLFLNPDNWWAALQRAELFETMGDHLEAHRHYRIVLEGLAIAAGSPFDRTLAVGPLSGLETTREAAQTQSVRALDRLVGGV